MANITILTTPGGRDDDLVCVHNPCYLEFSVKKLEEGSGFALLSININFDSVDYKPYKYSEDGVYNYYRIQLSEIFKSSMISFDFDNHGSSNTTASNLYYDDTLTIEADYDNVGLDSFAIDYTLFHCAKDTGEETFNRKAYEGTYYQDKKVYYYHGYPFVMFSYLSSDITDTGPSIQTNDRPNLNNTGVSHTYNMLQLGQNQIGSFYVYKGATVRDIGVSTSNEGDITFYGNEYRMKLNYDAAFLTSFTLDTVGTDRYTTYNLDFIYNAIADGQSRSLIRFNQGTALKIINNSGAYVIALDGGTDDPSYLEISQIEPPNKRILLNFFFDKQRGNYFVYAHGQCHLSDENALLDFSNPIFEPNIDGQLYSMWVMSQERTEYAAPIYQTCGSESYTIEAATGVSADFTMVTRQQHGVFLRWLTRDGVYVSYLFDCVNISNKSSDEIGLILNNDKNRELIGPSLETILVHDSRNKSLGRESQVDIGIITKLIDNQELEFVETIIDSPEIYLFIKPIGAADILANWERVSIDGQVVRSSKNYKTKIELTLIRSQQYNVRR